MRKLQDNEENLINRVAKGNIIEILTMIVAEIPSVTNILIKYLQEKDL